MYWFARTTQPYCHCHCPCSSDTACSLLLAALPQLQRLTAKRVTGLRAAWRRVQALLKALPNPAAAALAQLRPCTAWQAFLWAYSVARTRGVTLEVEELPAHVAARLQERGVEDVGVMVPLLDMANHGSGQQVGVVCSMFGLFHLVVMHWPQLIRGQGRGYGVWG